MSQHDTKVGAKKSDTKNKGFLANLLGEVLSNIILSLLGISIPISFMVIPETMLKISGQMMAISVEMLRMSAEFMIAFEKKMFNIF